jgi:acetyl esterase/lipase
MAPKEKRLFPKNSSLDDSSCSNDGGAQAASIPWKPAGDTHVFATADGAPYVICNSSKPFVNPTTPPNMTPQEINSTLNLTLGVSPKILRHRSAVPRTVLWIMELLDRLCVSWWEPYFMHFYAEIIPAAWKRCLIFRAWKYYLSFHRWLLHKKTGLHPSLSAEYHAITTLMWWGQFLVITPERIRFSLGQLYIIAPSDIPTCERVESISVNQTDNLQKEGVEIPQSAQEHCTVKGLFVHCKGDKYRDSVVNEINNVAKKKTRKIIFWIYGGAYLGGDCRGNITTADEFGKDCDMDGVFIPDLRLAPEFTIDDVLWDVCLAYQWACRELVEDPSKQIVVLGLSSGAALGLRLMQLISERCQEPRASLQPAILESLLDKCDFVRQPRAGMLFGPYVDYTEPKKGSFLHYAKHDLVVSEAVQHYGLPYLNGFIPKVGEEDELKNYNARGRQEYSPALRAMDGLPSLCFVVSEHEACYDMTIQSINSARAAGVDVTVGVWKYLCHVFSFLHSFVPEGKLSIEFSKEWIRQKTGSIKN